jgi:hypothetical protein
MLATNSCIGSAAYETLYQYAQKHIHSQPVYALPNNARRATDPFWSSDRKLLADELCPALTKVHAPKEEGHMDALRLLVPTPVSSILTLDFQTDIDGEMYRAALISGLYVPREVDSLMLQLGGACFEWISSECTHMSNQELLLSERLALQQSFSTRDIIRQELQLESSAYSHPVFNSEDRITIDGEPYARCQLFRPFFPAGVLSLYRGRITFPVQCLVYVEIALLPKSCLEAVMYKNSPSALWSLMKDLSIPKPLDTDPCYYLSDTKTIAARKGYGWMPEIYFTDNDHGLRIDMPDVTLFEPAYIHQ